MDPSQLQEFLQEPLRNPTARARPPSVGETSSAGASRSSSVSLSIRESYIETLTVKELRSRVSRKVGDEEFQVMEHSAVVCRLDGELHAFWSLRLRLEDIGTSDEQKRVDNAAKLRDSRVEYGKLQAKIDRETDIGESLRGESGQMKGEVTAADSNWQQTRARSDDVDREIADK